MTDDETKAWYYASTGNERCGPVSLGELAGLWTAGVIRAETLVWSPEQPSWIAAEKISHLLVRDQEALIPEVAPRVQEPLPPSDLKPRKALFLFPRITTGIVISAMFSTVVIGALVIAEFPWWPGLAVFSVLAAFTILSALAAYRKERYELRDTRLLCHRGGLFSDQTYEFEIRNITQVKIIMPWLRFKFFRIGDVIVSTAGTSVPMVMRAIRNPEGTYSEIRARMTRNGYCLTQTQLLHEEKPATLGIIVDCLGQIVAVAAIIVFMFGGIVIEQVDSGTNPFGAYLPLVAAGIVIPLIIYLVLRFLDFRRRTYRVFNDVVVYEEGFLTRHNAFIPYENIADSNTKRTLIDQILGLFDVHVSCQGSSSEIKFRRLANGVALSAAIDQLVILASRKPKPAKRTLPEGAMPSIRRAEPEPVPIGQALNIEMGIHGWRLMVPLLLLLPLFPLWIGAMVQAIIKLTSTRYHVRPDSIRHSYRFLTVSDREFANEKITGVVVKRNPWDKLFGTMTVKFLSIGSGRALEFAHLKCSLVDLPALLRQVGIPAGGTQEFFNAKATFGLSAWLRASLRSILILLVFVIAIVVISSQTDPEAYWLLIFPALIAILGLVHAMLYYSRQRLRFHAHHVEAEQGILAKRHHYVRHRNIKRVKSTRYPGGTEGKLEIFIAGEEEIQFQGKQGKNLKGMMKQSSFTTGLLVDTRETAALLDDILCGRAEAAPDAMPAEPLVPVLEARRSVGNSLIALILLSILIFPLFPLLPITIPIVIIWIKSWRYRIDKERVMTCHGVLFRSETSVLFDRVDSLQQRQGILNKLFRNGKVSIMTAGSSKPDLLLTDSPDYLKLHEEIRSRTV